MGAILAVARSTVRRRRSATVLLALLLMLATAASLGAWGGANRTDSAFDRFLLATNSPDLYVDGQFDPLDHDAISAIPGVAFAEPGAGFGMLAIGPDGLPDLEGRLGFGATMTELDSPLLLDGRFPDPGATDEFAVTRDIADELGGIGATVDTLTFDVFELFGAVEEAGGEPNDDEIRALMRRFGERHPLTITGIVLHREQVARSSDEEGEGGSLALVTPAFASGLEVEPTVEWSGVVLEDPTKDMSAVQQAVRRAHSDSSLELHTRAQLQELVDDSTRPYVQALRLFAAALGITAALVLGQAAAREAEIDAIAAAPLQALGMPRSAVVSAGLARSTVVGLVGVAAGVGLAAMSSRLFPIGPVRGFDPDRGTRVDATVLLAGGVVAALAIGAGGAFGARRGLRSRASSVSSASRTTATIEAIRLPIGVEVGVRAALSSRRDGLAGPGSRLAGAVMATIAISAALSFGAGLDRLVAEPARYGWTWDALLDTFDTEMDGETLAQLAADERFASVDVGVRGTAAIGGRSVAAFGFESLRGDGLLPVRAGTPPIEADEVALGPRTLSRAGLELGDEVAIVGAGGETTRFRIVGEAVFPAMDIDTTTALSEGAAFTAAGFAAIAGGEPTFALVDLADAAEFEEVADDYNGIGQLFGPQQPGEIVSYDRVRGVPILLAAVLGALGAGVLAHGLLTATGRDRRDLAILKAIGFGRRQVASTVVWHALTVAAVGLLVGVPVGVAGGRTLWRGFTDNLGAGGPPVTPVLGLVLLVLAAAVAALAVSGLPARQAATVRPATALRSE